MSGNNGRSVPVSVSQNFLTSKATINRLLRLTDIAPSDTVLEIGAGKGHITCELASRAARVISYEIDEELARKLAPTLPDNVQLHARDFLHCALPQSPYKVFANLPFFLTTDILRKLTRGDRAPDAAWLIVEKGAAKRFCGQPRESKMSLSLKPLYDMRITSPCAARTSTPPRAWTACCWSCAASKPPTCSRATSPRSCALWSARSSGD